MAAGGQIERAALALFNEPAATLVPRLIDEKKAPHRVAAALGVAPNAVRKWLIHRNWSFDGAKWVAPETEHA